MPYPSLTFEQLLSNATAAELNQFVSLLQGYLSAEHKEDGTHASITADAIEVAAGDGITLPADGVTPYQFDVPSGTLDITGAESASGRNLLLRSRWSGSGTKSAGVTLSASGIPNGDSAASVTVRSNGSLGGASVSLSADTVSMLPAGSGISTAVSITGSLTASGDISTTGWTDYSGTSTITGWSAFTTKKLSYKKVGSLVLVAYEFVGTSDSTSTSFTLPHTNGSGFDIGHAPVFVKDNGAFLTTTPIGLLATAASTVNLYTTQDAVGWTAANTKQVVGQFWYQV